MSLHAKIAAVMGEIGTIPKNGWNDFHRYKYVLESDIVDAVRMKLSEKGVAFYAASKIIETREWQTPKGKPTLITHVQVELTFADGESGETFTITSAGSGDDASDKGTYKAITGAVKYGLMKTFLIPTGDDPEQQDAPAAQVTEPVVEYASKAQNAAIAAEQDMMISLLGMEAAREAYEQELATVGVKPGSAATVAQADALIARLRTHTAVPA